MLDLAKFKQAEHKLSRLIQTLPTLDQALNYQLEIYFPEFVPDANTHNLFITYQAPPTPGQQPTLISYSLNALIESCYVSRQVPSLEIQQANIYTAEYTIDKKHLVQNIQMSRIEDFVKHVTNNLKRCVIEALASHWFFPNKTLEHISPKAWLATVVRELVSAEADLRLGDKTLSAAAYAAVKHLCSISAPNEPDESELNNSLVVYRVGLNVPMPKSSIALQGLFVIANKTFTDVGDRGHSFNSAQQPTLTLEGHKVVLYTPSSGLEEFESLYALSLELKERHADIYQCKALINCTFLKDREQESSLNSIGYQTITADVFEAYASTIMNKQIQDITHTWEVARTEDTQYRLEILAKHVEDALHIHLNPAAILRARYTRLLETQLPVWLTSASEENKQLWRQAVERLKQEKLISQTADNMHLLEFGQKSALLAYAKARLKEQIRADHALDIDPDQVFIVNISEHEFHRILESAQTTATAFLVAFNALKNRPSSNTRSLSEFSLENIGPIHLNFALTASILDAEGKIHPALTPTYIKNLVRTLNIGSDYAALLNKTLVDPNSTQAIWHKERYIAVTAAQLNLDILVAQLKGDITPTEASWVETALAYTVESQRPAINDTPIKVHFLTLRDQPVPEMIVINPQGSSRIICYTPNAPDSVEFRRANSLNELAIALSNKLLNGYILHLTTFATQPYISHSLKTNLDTPTVGLQLITTDFLHALYAQGAAFSMRNADELSNSTYETNVQTAKDVALLTLDVVSFFLPLKILLPLALVFFVSSLIDGFDALERGEKKEAIYHFLGAVLHLIDGASDVACSIVFRKAIRKRPSTPLITLNPQAASKLSTTDMKPHNSDDYGRDVYEYTRPDTGQTLYYLQDIQGDLYRGQYDNLNETWRIIDERQPDAIYNTPVSQLSEGRWGIPFGAPSTGISLQEIIETARVHVNLADQVMGVNGIYTVNNLSYIQQNGIVFEVQKGWRRQNLYLNMQGASHSSTHRYKVRRNAESGEWEIKYLLADMTKKWEPLNLNKSRQASISSDSYAVSYSHYDAHLQHVDALQEMTERKAINFQEASFHQGTAWELARSHMDHIQKSMFLDALQLFKTRTQITRAKVANLRADTPMEGIFKVFHEHYAGIVIAESHASTASKKILIDNMDYLAKSKVKILYMEHLQTDLHQGLLDIFFKTGKMPPDLMKFLKKMDNQFGVDVRTIYTYRHLVYEAQKHGIKVKAIDCVASYNTAGLKHRDSKSVRHEMMNYGASKIIREHHKTEGTHQWIALVGNTHANTFRGVPGLAELEGVVGLRIEDVMPGTSQGIRHDRGIVDAAPGTKGQYSLLKNDWLLSIETPIKGPHPPPLPDAILAKRLPHYGMYLFENNPELGPIFIHRAQNGDMVRTPFIFNEDGTFYVNQPIWPGVHRTPYSNLDAMVKELIDRGLLQHHRPV